MSTATADAPTACTGAVPRTPRKRTFRILFKIDGLSYAVVPLLPDPAVASRAYRLRKLSGEPGTYDVCLAEHGAECECKGFLRWRHCKHIRCLVAAGMLPGPEEKAGA
jgi:hypothetical protein